MALRVFGYGTLPAGNRNAVALKNDRPFHNFVTYPLLDDFNRQHGTNLTLCGITHGFRIFTDPHRIVRDIPPFRVSALIAHERAGTAFKDEIVFTSEDGTRIVLPTDRFKGQRNAAIVVLNLTASELKVDGKATVVDVTPDILIFIVTTPSTKVLGFFVV